MVPLPLVKLVGLAVKQFISKPVAQLCKSQVKTKPFLRDKICIPIGRGYHNFKERFTRVTSVHGLSSAKIPLRKIDDETAMDIGAELIGETAIYVIAVLVLISEGIKWSNKVSEREAAETLASEQAALLQQQHDQLMRDVDSLKAQVVDVDSLKAQVAAFKSTIKELEARNAGPTLVPRCKYSDRN